MPAYVFRNTIILFAIIVCSSCVSGKKYREELGARKAAEAREQVLVRELMDRKQETTALTKQVGELNRLVGNQEALVRDLKEEVSARAAIMGESSGKLLSEIDKLENDLSDKSAQLAEKNAQVIRVQKAQGQRNKLLNEIHDALYQAYEASGQAGVVVEINQDAVWLTLPDKSLFEPNGVAISVSGKTLLAPLSELLGNRPELDAEIWAHTDNTLPKDNKALKDTWDWSLVRAVTLLRILTRDYNISANQLTPVAKGEFYPLTSNDTADGRQKNRRTVVVIHPVLPVIPVLD